MVVHKISPRKCKKLAEGFDIFAWSALTVTAKAIDSDNGEIQVTLTKEELLEMLAKIQKREQEIKNLNEGRGMYENF